MRPASTRQFRPISPSASRGYTLLFAVLTAALVLGVAVFIVSISTKQFELSASARNSMYSFYAADSGVECISGAFTNLLPGTEISTSSGAVLSCNGATSPAIPFDQLASVPAGLEGVFSTAVYPYIYRSQPGLNFATPGGTCVVITIYDGYSSTGDHYTLAESRGYNHCVAATHIPDTTVPNTVERALRILKQG